jgi:hypothetical protein
MARKRRLEAAEAVTGMPDLNSPLLMTDDELTFWYGLLEQVLNERSANAPLQTAPARRDEGKSEGRREFDAMIFRIADKLKDAPPAPVPPLVLSHAAPSHAEPTEAANAGDGLPASELLKVLRRKLGLER